MVNQRVMRKALKQSRAYHKCVKAGTHPTPSEKQEERILGGKGPFPMERCRVCNVLTPVERFPR